MSSRPVVLPASGHPALRVTTRSGRVAITAEERQDVLIEEGAPPAEEIEFDASGEISLTSARGGSASIAIRCPTGAAVVVGTASGRVELQGPFGDVRVTTASGSIQVDRAELLDIRSASGSIDVRRCAGRCRLQTASGQATVGSADDVEVSTASGQIRLGWASGSVRVRTASGSVQVGTLGGGDVGVQTLSGAVKVEVPAGVRPAVRLTSLSGSPRCDCEEGDDCRIAVSTMSGRIEVTLAP